MNEAESYLQDEPLDKEEFPLQWWKKNQHHSLLIVQVANTLLFQPLMLTECVFSIASKTVTRIRSCLTPEHVHMLVFLTKCLLYCTCNIVV